MVRKTLYGVVRRAVDYPGEFALKNEICLEMQPARALAQRIKISANPYDKANPVVRVARFTLIEEELNT